MVDADGDTKIQVEESSDEDKIRFDTAGQQRMVINSSGNIGIGIASSIDGRLHVSSGTSGDAKVIIEADTDNNNESDNPRLEFRQDAALVTASVSIEPISSPPTCI